MTISFNSTRVVGGRVKLCLNHPLKPGGIIIWGMWAIFWGVTSIPYFRGLFSAHWYLGAHGDTGVLHHVPGDIGCWGDSKLAGVPVGQGPDIDVTNGGGQF